MCYGAHGFYEILVYFGEEDVGLPRMFEKSLFEIVGVFARECLMVDIRITYMCVYGFM